MQSKKVFALGVGAQKAGTSWLHYQLDSYTDGFLFSSYKSQQRINLFDSEA